MDASARLSLLTGSQLFASCDTLYSLLLRRSCSRTSRQDQVYVYVQLDKSDRYLQIPSLNSQDTVRSAGMIAHSVFLYSTQRAKTIVRIRRTDVHVGCPQNVCAPGIRVRLSHMHHSMGIFTTNEGYASQTLQARHRSKQVYNRNDRTDGKVDEDDTLHANRIACLDTPRLLIMYTYLDIELLKAASWAQS
jgi:hypothetical protein